MTSHLFWVHHSHFSRECGSHAKISFVYATRSLNNPLRGKYVSAWLFCAWSSTNYPMLGYFYLFYFCIRKKYPRVWSPPRLHKHELVLVFAVNLTTSTKHKVSLAVASQHFSEDGWRELDLIFRVFGFVCVIFSLLLSTHAFMHFLLPLNRTKGITNQTWSFFLISNQFPRRL